LPLPPFRQLQAIGTHSACFRVSKQHIVCLLIYLRVAGRLRASVMLNWLLLSCCSLLPLLITTGGCHPQVRLCKGVLDTNSSISDWFGHCLHAAGLQSKCVLSQPSCSYSLPASETAQHLGLSCCKLFLFQKNCFACAAGLVWLPLVLVLASGPRWQRGCQAGPPSLVLRGDQLRP
jgi:hypothetical protein